MSYRNFRSQALALCITAGLTASAGIFSPQAPAGDKTAFPFLPKTSTVYTPKAITADGVMTPDKENLGDYYAASNTLGSVFTPDGEEWFYIVDLDGTCLNPGNPYYVDMDFTGFTLKVYDSQMNLKGQVKGDIIRPEGTLKCRQVEVCPQLTRSFFNTNPSDYEVMLTFAFNPDNDANGNPRYGAKETTQAYSLTEEIPEGGSKLLFQAPGYYTSAINLRTSGAENFIMAFIEESSWDGEDTTHAGFAIYTKAGYGTSAALMQRFSIATLYAMADGYNEGMPFAMTAKGKDIYVATALYEKTFLKDPTADEPVQNPDNNFVINLYKSSNGAAFELEHTTKIKMEEPSDGFAFRSYALGNFSGFNDITFDFGNGTDPCYILTVVDSDNTDETTGRYVVYNLDGNALKTFGEESDSFIQFDGTATLAKEYGFYMTASDGNYGVVLFDYPSFQETGFLPILFEYESDAWNVISVPARVQTPTGVLYAASVLPSGENGDGASHYVAWFRKDGSLDHVDSLFLGDDVAKVLTYIHDSVLNPYLFNTDKNTEYFCWIYRYAYGTSKTSLELAIVDTKGNILAKRLMPENFSYEYAYVSNTATNPGIIICYRDGTTGASEQSYKMEYISLPLNDFEGEGTMESPYLVKTFGDFNRIRYNTASHFRITNSIDATGQIFLPIENEFTGSIDGGNFDISNLIVSGNNTGTAIFSTFGHNALYGETPVTARMSNINFVNPTICFNGSNTGTKTLGIIAANMYNAELKSVNIVNPQMNIDGVSMKFGGVAGVADNVVYSNSFITGADFYAPLAGNFGGAFGEIRSGEISKVSFDGKINGRGNIGGLIGNNSTGTLSVSDVHVNAEITGGNNVGGIGGMWNREKINRAFVEGKITANDYVGGIVGSIALADPARRDAEGDDYKVLDNCLVGLESITVAPNAQYSHRIFGHSVIDLGDRKEWLVDPEDNEKGEYVDVPAAEESKLGTNYVVSALGVVGADNSAVSEGTVNTTGISDSEWLAGLGFAVASSPALASETTPWVYSSTALPELYFEATANASMHIIDAELTGKVGDTVIATLLASNVEFDNLEFESSNAAVAELADLTLGENGAVNVHIQLNAAGTADITLKYGVAHRAVIHVTALEAVPSLSFRNTSHTGESNSSIELILDFDNLAVEDITATSSDETIAAISSVAKGSADKVAIVAVDLKKIGTAEITASARSLVAKATIQVQKTTDGVSGVKVSVISYAGLEISADGHAIEVFDLQGRQVAYGFGTLSVANIAQGVYIVRATAPDGSVVTLKINR